jgi:acyl-CoA dehydrogenase family protein 9
MRLRPDRLQGAHPSLAKQVGAIAEQTARLRGGAEAALRKYGSKVQEKQLVQKRLADAAAGIYAQIATVSRASAVIARDGVIASEAERTVAVSFCDGQARAVARSLRALETNDDKRSHEIGRATRASAGYTFTL